MSEPPCPPPLSHCHHARGTLGAGGLGWELAEVAAITCLQNRTQLSTHMWSTSSLSLSLGSGAYPGFL